MLARLLTDGRAWCVCAWRIVYRLNTFPFIHLNVFHALMNVLALTPLLERFESEYGTLTSLALFFGRGLFPCSWRGKPDALTCWWLALTTVPAFLYVGWEKWLLRANTAVMGARWVARALEGRCLAAMAC